MITGRVVDEATAWHIKHNKPVLMSEYGADTIEGLHLVRDSKKHNSLTIYKMRPFFPLQLPSFVWSEEYQKDLFGRHFRAFDILRAKGFFIGEFVWNFADFKTDQCKNYLKSAVIY